MKLFVLHSEYGSACPYVIESIVKALRAAGHNVFLFNADPPDSAKQENIVLECGRAVADFGPDAVLFYAIPRGRGFIADSGDMLFEEWGVPYVSLFFDNPFTYFQELGTTVVSRLKNSSYYMAFCSDQEYVERMRGFGFTGTAYMPLAADPELFFSLDGHAGGLCDVSFVGSVEKSLSDVISRRRVRWAKYPQLNHAIDLMTLPGANESSVQIAKKLDNFRSQMPWDMFAVFCRTVYDEANTSIRLQTIAGITECSVKVYGNSGWKDLRAPNVEYCGPVSYWPDLNTVYHGTRINLNITGPQLLTGLTQRIFDAGAGANFILSDEREDLYRLFLDTVVSYRDRSDMNKKIQYFLKHEDERREHALAAQKIIKKNHTWSHRACQLADAIGAKIKSASYR
jgi:spore maturation protein CgeB